MSAKGKKYLTVIAILVVLVPLAFVLLWNFLQGPFAHRLHPFSPDYEQVELTSVLARESLNTEDYALLYAQTGLGPLAIDDLRAMGQAGIDQITATQEAFFHAPGEDVCSPLGVTTGEHRYRDETGRVVPAAPMAPLKEGDIIVSLSTHTAGWTHGHAGLVMDPDRPITLESVVLGSLSDTMNASHWRSYTTWAVLRPRSDEGTRHQVVQIADQHLIGIPYSPVSGVFGDKFQPLDGSHDAQCGYLPWYAWMAVGVDLDSDGGRVVTPEDLLLSDQIDIVQIYGMDPAEHPLGFENQAGQKT